MRVECEVSFVELTGTHGRAVDGVSASCSRCGHEEESFGSGDSSVKRCLALLRENCPEGEENFYFDVDGDE